KGANIEAVTASGNTAMHLAVLTAQKDITLLLQSHSACTTIQNKWKLNCTQLAVLLGNKQMISVLLTEKEACLPPAQITILREDYDLLRIIVNDIKKHAVIVEMIKSTGYSPSRCDHLYINIMLESHRFEIPDPAGRTPLYRAVTEGKVEVVKILIENDAY